MPALPPLEGEIRLDDETGAGFESAQRNAERFNRALERTQTTLDQTTTKLQTNLGQLDFGPDLLAGNPQLQEILGLAPAVEEVKDQVQQVQEHVEQLGQTNIRPLVNQMAAASKQVDDFEDKARRMRRETDENAKGFERFAETLSQLDNTPILEALPGAQELSILGELGSFLPKLTTGNLLLAGSLGIVAAAGVGAVAGLGALVDAQDALETRTAQKGQLADRLGINPSDVDDAIEELRQKLDNRLSREEALKFSLEVDPAGAIDSLGEFGDIAQTVQKYADKFGLDWRTTLTQVTEAIEKGDGKFLEQKGLIENANAALSIYAQAHDKNIAQLSETEKKQALIDALLRENISTLGDSATATDNLKVANEKLSATFNDVKDSAVDWFSTTATAAHLLGPLASAQSGWENALEALDRSLRERTANNRTMAALSETEQAEYQSLLERKEALIRLKTDTETAVGEATHLGTDDSVIAGFQTDVDELQAAYEILDRTIANIQERVVNGEKNFDVPTADQIAPIPDLTPELGDFFSIPDVAITEEMRRKIAAVIADLDGQL
ncbi:MAG TPA: hypothetical protein PKE45_14160, partial [Caldilineaceae bacterium]|nr:hypothetical protein [Caldilineaceae bacterium]